MDETFVIVDKNGSDEMPNKVDICLLVDRSGSMNSMIEETFLGVKNFVKDQKETASDTGIPTNITIKTFDDYCEIMEGFNAEDILNVPEINTKYLKPRGKTKLIDTVVESLLEQNRRYIEWNTKNNDKNVTMKRVFAVLTDGFDNCSRLYNDIQLNLFITRFRKEGVVCMFLGANQDAIDQGSKYGFDLDHTLSYTAKGDFASNTFRSLSQQVSSACRGDKDTSFTELQRTKSCEKVIKNSNVDPCSLRRC